MIQQLEDLLNISFDGTLRRVVWHLGRLPMWLERTLDNKILSITVPLTSMDSWLEFRREQLIELRKKSEQAREMLVEYQGFLCVRIYLLEAEWRSRPLLKRSLKRLLEVRRRWIQWLTYWSEEQAV